MEAFNFTAASEDCNLYSYDLRKLDSATNVHKVGVCNGPVFLCKCAACYITGHDLQHGMCNA